MKHWCPADVKAIVKPKFLVSSRSGVGGLYLVEEGDAGGWHVRCVNRTPEGLVRGGWYSPPPMRLSDGRIIAGLKCIGLSIWQLCIALTALDSEVVAKGKTWEEMSHLGV